MVDRATTVAFVPWAFSAALTIELVVPEPEAASSRSPCCIAGVVVSPTTWTERPRCMRRMAKAFIIRPVLPAPITKMRFACCMCIASVAMAVMSILPDRRTFSSSIMGRSVLKRLASASLSNVNMCTKLGSMAPFALHDSHQSIG